MWELNWKKFFRYETWTIANIIFIEQANEKRRSDEEEDTEEDKVKIMNELIESGKIDGVWIREFVGLSDKSSWCYIIPHKIWDTMKFKK